MATSATFLSVTEYESIYGSESGWEFWFGEAVRKPVPTKFHGILQMLLGELLRLAGYISTVEAELRNVADWRPRPDVYGVLEDFEGDYPVLPVDVVFEILSPGEDIAEKCRHYAESLIPAIFVFDPVEQTIQEWQDGKLNIRQAVKLGNGVTIAGEDIWRQFSQRKKPLTGSRSSE